MPFCKCPHCGAEFHLQAGQPDEQWRLERGLSLEGLAPVCCLRCFKLGRDDHRLNSPQAASDLPAPTLVEGVLWVLAAPQQNPAYDFEFERFFACSHPPTLPHQITAVARLGALENYATAFERYKAAGLSLIHDPEIHLRCTRLPNWYPLLSDLTPKSIIIDGAPEIDRIEKELGWPVFVKGERQTNRHRKALSIANNVEELGQILSLFVADPILSWQRPVLRQFAKLRPVSGGLSEEIPPSFEFRTFWWKGRLVGFGRYWISAEPYDVTPAERSAATQIAGEAARRLNATFVVIDVACTQEGRWIVIEPNDGQESGYSGVNPIEMWRRIVDIEQSPTTEQNG